MCLRLPFALLLLVAAALIVLLVPGCGYNGCADIPVLESISPTSATAGGPTFTMTLTGRHFHSDTIFFFGHTELASTTVSSSEMTATIDATYIALPAIVQVFVSGIPGGSNLGGPCGGGPSNKIPFSIN